MHSFLLALLIAAPVVDTVPNLPPVGGMESGVSKYRTVSSSPAPRPAAASSSGTGVTVLRVDSRDDPLPRDAWVAEDKLKHFFTSFALTAFAFSGARAVGMDDSAALGAAVATSAAAGIGKEIYDLRTQGRFSLRDMAWNIAGITLGAALLREAR